MLFISYSSKDRTVAQELYDRLTRYGYRLPFLDYHPDGGIPGGTDWRRELRWQLRVAGSVIALCSENWKTSAWCSEELGTAHALEKPVIPLNIDGCELPSTIDSHQQINFVRRDEEAYARLWKALEAAESLPNQDFSWPRKECPYPGFAAFQEHHAGVYFGRESELRAFRSDHLTPMRDTGEPRLVFVIGPSGSGKSSFVRAGVLPRLKFDTSTPTHLLTTFRWSELRRDGQSWHERLACDLQAVYRDHPKRPQWSLQERIDRYSTASSGMEAAARRYILDVKEFQSVMSVGRSMPLLVLDQFEEMLTDVSARGFMQFLGCCLGTEESPCRAIATVRADFLAAIQEHPELIAWNERTRLFRLDLLKPDRLFDVVRRPTELVETQFESEALVNRLVAEARTPDALPLLAFTLKQFYETCSSRGSLTTDDYESRVGGIERCLQSVADQVLSAVTPDTSFPSPPSAADIAAIRRSFVSHLAEYQEGAGTYSRAVFLRRRARCSDLPPRALPFLERMAAPQYRLLTIDRPTARDSSDTTIEVTHEALFRVWATLRNWLNETLDGHVLRSRVDQLRLYWLNRGRRIENLCPLGLVEESSAWEASEPGWFTQEQLSYLEDSRAHHQAALTELIRLKDEAQSQALIARRQARIAESRRIATLSEAQRRSRLDRALLLAADAMLVQSTLEARDALLRVLSMRPEVGSLLGDMSAAHAVAFSPDGSALAVATSSEVIVFDLATLERRQMFVPKRSIASAVVFSPDGERIAIACTRFTLDFGVLVVLDGVGRDIGMQPFDFGGHVYSLVFTNNRRLVVSLRDDIRLAEVDTGPIAVETLIQTPGQYVKLAYAPHQKLLAAGCFGGRVELFDCGSDRPQCLSEGIQLEGAYIRCVEFSVDGRWLAVGFSSQDTPDIINLYETGKEGLRSAQRSLRLPHGDLRCMRFHPDSAQLLVGYRVAEGSAGLFAFDLESDASAPPRSLAMCETEVRSLAFRGDGLLAASVIEAGDERMQRATVALLDLHRSQSVAPRVPLPKGVMALAASPDGQYLALAFRGGVVTIDPRTGLHRNPVVPTPEGQVVAIHFAPAGALCAAVLRRGSDEEDTGESGLVLFDADIRNCIGRVQLPSDVRRIVSVEFRHDNGMLAACVERDMRQQWLFVDPTTLNVYAEGPPVERISFSGSHTALSRSFDHIANVAGEEIQLTRALTGEPLGTIAPTGGKFGKVDAVLFSPDGKRLAASYADDSRRSFWLWRVELGLWQQLGEVTDPQRTVDRFLFSRNGGLLVAQRGTSAEVFQIEATSTRHTRLSIGRTYFASPLAINSKGTLLAEGGGGARLFDTATGRRFVSEPLGAPDGAMKALAFVANDSLLAACYENEETGVVLWDTDPESWVRRAKQVANRALTENEWQRFFPDRPYLSDFDAALAITP
jgi:WD40 repeat protein